MDKVLQDELNVDPWTPPDPALSTTFTTVADHSTGPAKIARCPTCKGPLIAAVTRESDVTVGVCVPCRRRVAMSVLEAQS